MKATEILMEEHGLILRAVAVVEKMAERAERGEDVPSGDVEEILRFLEEFADQHHQGREEAVLFPAMLKSSPADYDKLSTMVFEHDQERSLVDGIQDSIRTHQTRDFAFYAARLAQVLRGHIQKEDTVLFQMVDAGFSPEQDARVAGELAAFDAPWQKAQLPSLLASLSELERKYVPATA